MQKINTLAELKAAKMNLEVRKTYLEAEIKKDFEDLKAELAPLKSVTKTAETVLVSKNNGILGSSLGQIANFVTKNVLLKNSGFLTRLIVPYIIKKTTSNIVENNKTSLVGWISSLASKLTKPTTVEG